MPALGIETFFSKISPFSGPVVTSRRFRIVFVVVMIQWSRSRMTRGFFFVFVENPVIGFDQFLYKNANAVSNLSYKILLGF